MVCGMIYGARIPDPTKGKSLVIELPGSINYSQVGQDVLIELQAFIMHLTKVFSKVMLGAHHRSENYYYLCRHFWVDSI